VNGGGLHQHESCSTGRMEVFRFSIHDHPWRRDESRAEKGTGASRVIPRCLGSAAHPCRIAKPCDANHFHVTSLFHPLRLESDNHVMSGAWLRFVLAGDVDCLSEDSGDHNADQPRQLKRILMGETTEYETNGHSACV